MPQTYPTLQSTELTNEFCWYQQGTKAPVLQQKVIDTYIQGVVDAHGHDSDMQQRIEENWINIPLVTA